MAWFWKKKQAAETQAPAEAAAAQAVDQAVAAAQRTDKEWRRQAARQAQEEKRREKERERAAKKAMKEMQKQVKTARKERQAAEKRVKKQARAVLKLQRKEMKAERKRVKIATRTARRNEKRRKSMVRRRQKEERRRRKRMRQQDDLLRERDQAVIETEELRNMTVVNAATAEAMAARVVLGEPPKFKEDKRCKSCYLKFQRLPTRRRHHCRNCGESCCSKCLSGVKRPIPWFKLDKPQKVCFSCDVAVFNGMGGASRTASASARTASPPPSASTPTPEDTAVPSPPQSLQQESDRSPLRAQRSASFESEQPEDSPRSSPASRSGLSFRLHPRSRREQSSSSKSKKGSLWTLPIRPLLKRKASADQLRNRAWDFDLRIEKEEMLARQRKSQMMLVTRGPQLAQAS